MHILVSIVEELVIWLLAMVKVKHASIGREREKEREKERERERSTQPNTCTNKPTH